MSKIEDLNPDIDPKCPYHHCGRGSCICEFELKRVTRVACELWKLYLQDTIGHGLYRADALVCLSEPTQKWVREHELIDKKRRTKK